MNTELISHADLLDILFDGRNKAYGAYDLRRNYNRRLFHALSIVGGSSILLTALYLFTPHWKGAASSGPYPVTEFKLTDIFYPEKKVEPLLLPKATLPNVRSFPLTNPLLVDRKIILPEERPPEQHELEGERIGITNQQGVAEGDNSVPPVSNSNGVVEAPKNPPHEDSLFIKVEIPSSYPAGEEGWRRFLQKNFHYPQEAIDKGIQGTVLVEFIVDKEGNVSQVEAVSGPQELKEEAVRVIRTSGKWKPAIQNGREVKSFNRQPIAVRLEAE